MNITISKSGLQSGDPLSLLKFAWLINSEKLKSEFLKANIEIENEADLILLSDISTKKIDVEGKIKDKNGNPIMFDVVRIVTGLKNYTEQEKAKAKTFDYIA